MIGIWDAPPLQKTPEEEEAERRRREAVAFGGAMDRDPNRMRQLLEQASRNRMLGQPGGDVVPIEPDIAGGEPDSAPTGAPPAMPQPLTGRRRPIRTVQNLGGEGPTVRANTPGLAQIEGRAAVEPEGWKNEEDQAVMAKQMAQATESNALRDKVNDLFHESMANRQRRPPPRLKTTFGPRTGLGSQYFDRGVPIEPEQPLQLPAKGGASVLAALIRARSQQGKIDPNSEEVYQRKAALANTQAEGRKAVAQIPAEQVRLNREQRPTEIAQRIEGRIKIGDRSATAAEHLADTKAKLSMEEAKFVEAQRNGRADSKMKQDYLVHLENQLANTIKLRESKMAQPEGGFMGYGQHPSEELSKINEMEARIKAAIKQMGGS